jgi:hypothetical protein
VEDPDLAQHVAERVDLRRAPAQRRLHVRHRLERLVVDDDPVGRSARELGMLGRDDRDRFADVPNDLPREHRLIRELEPVEADAWHVVGEQHRVHTRARDGGGYVDRPDPRARVRAAERVTPEHLVGPQVAAVGELSLHLRDAVDPRDRGADAFADAFVDPPAHSSSSRRLMRSAAIRTASRIFS